MTTLDQFLQECEAIGHDIRNLQQFFSEVKGSEFDVFSVNVDSEFEILQVYEDCVLIKQESYFDESVKAGVFLHPYGSALAYGLKKKK